MFRGKHLDYYDWFSSNLGEQLKHEALVRDYVLKHSNIQEI